MAIVNSPHKLHAAFNPQNFLVRDTSTGGADTLEDFSNIDERIENGIYWGANLSANAWEGRASTVYTFGTTFYGYPLYAATASNRQTYDTFPSNMQYITPPRYFSSQDLADAGDFYAYIMYWVKNDNDPNSYENRTTSGRTSFAANVRYCRNGGGNIFDNGAGGGVGFGVNIEDSSVKCAGFMVFTNPRNCVNTSTNRPQLSFATTATYAGVSSGAGTGMHRFDKFYIGMIRHKVPLYTSYNIIYQNSNSPELYSQPREIDYRLPDDPITNDFDASNYIIPFALTKEHYAIVKDPYPFVGTLQEIKDHGVGGGFVDPVKNIIIEPQYPNTPKQYRFDPVVEGLGGEKEANVESVTSRLFQHKRENITDSVIADYNLVSAYKHVESEDIFYPVAASALVGRSCDVELQRKASVWPLCSMPDVPKLIQYAGCPLQLSILTDGAARSINFSGTSIAIPAERANHTELVPPLLLVNVPEGSTNAVFDGTTIPIEQGCTPVSAFYVRWIRPAGGYDYFMFKHNKVITPTLEEQDTFKPFIENSEEADATELSYRMDGSNLIECIAEVLEAWQVKALAGLVHSPLIEYYDTEADKFVRIFLNSSDTSINTAAPLGSVSFVFRQTGLFLQP